MRKLTLYALVMGLAALVSAPAAAADPTPPSQPCGPAFIEVRVTDLERSEAFYGRLLGWHFERLLPGLATAKLDGRPIATLQQTPRLPESQRVTVYFRVDRIEDAIARARANGGRVEQPAREVGAEMRAVVRDPDGNRIGLVAAKR